MSTTRQHLDEWQRAGLIDAATAERIRAYEEATAAPEREQRPGFLEALIYLGIAIVVVGVFVLAATNWGHLGSWERVLVTAVPAAGALAIGEFMRRQPHAGIRRGGSAAWFAAVALASGTAAVLMNEAGVAGEDGVTVAALVACVAAFVLWLRCPHELQVAAGAGALLLLSVAVAAQTSRADDDFAPLAGGGAMLLMGIAAIFATEAGVIFPRTICRVFEGLAIAIGSLVVAFGERSTVAIEFVPLAAGALLILLGIRLGFFPHIIFGLAVIFIGTIQLVVDHVHDPTLAALALMLLGAALIGVVLVLAKMRPWQRGGPGLRKPPALA